MEIHLFVLIVHNTWPSCALLVWNG